MNISTVVGVQCPSAIFPGAEEAMANTTDQHSSQLTRGRKAASPGQFPLSGWKDIAVRLAGQIGEDMVMLIAAGVTYYLLLALFPAMTAALSIYGLFADPATVQNQLSVLNGFIPGGGMQIIQDQLTRVAEQGAPTLGVTFVISLGAALWSASAGVKALFQAMNVAYEETESRGFLKLNALALAFTFAATLAAILFVGITVVMPTALNLIGLPKGTEWLVRIVSYLLVFVLAFAGIAALYRWGPSREQAKWRWVTPGATLTILAILVISILFTWYVANFGSYNKTYGSIGAVIGFMTWIWISSTILIIGAELNSEMERQTARDTTTGSALPMGRRGAAMADTVAGGNGSVQEGRARPDARPKRHSTVSLAYAIPAALVLLWMQKREQKRSD